MRARISRIETFFVKSAHARHIILFRDDGGRERKARMCVGMVGIAKTFHGLSILLLNMCVFVSGMYF